MRSSSGFSRRKNVTKWNSYVGVLSLIVSLISIKLLASFVAICVSVWCDRWLKVLFKYDTFISSSICCNWPFFWVIQCVGDTWLEDFRICRHILHWQSLTLLLLLLLNFFCHRSFLPGTSLEPAAIPTAQVSSFTLQYFPYYAWCSKYSCLL